MRPKLLVALLAFALILPRSITPVVLGCVRITASAVYDGGTAKCFKVEANNVTIRNFEITGAPISSITSGYGILDTGSNNVFEHNYIHDEPGGGIRAINSTIQYNTIVHVGQMGIQVYGGSLVQGNDISKTSQCYPGVGCTSTSDADGIRFFGPNNTLRSNTIHDIPVATMENPSPHIDCFQTWVDTWHPAATNNLIELNTCENMHPNARNSGDFGNTFQLKGARNLTIRGNYSHSEVGALLYDTTAEISNNDFVNRRDANLSYYPIGIGVHNSSVATIVYNRFYNEPGPVLRVDTNSVVTHYGNLLDGQPYDGSGPVTPTPTRVVTATPTRVPTLTPTLVILTPTQVLPTATPVSPTPTILPTKVRLPTSTPGGPTKVP